MDIALALELEIGIKDILDRGGCIFPICSDSKLPLPFPGEKIGKPGKGGYKLATNDPRVIWHYFREDPLPDDIPDGAIKTLKAWRKTEQPNAAVALDMSGWLVLDVDDISELKSFTERFGALPDTYCVSSPRAGGGFHYYFKTNIDMTYRRTIEGFPHLDIKHHGYVLIPGSVKRNNSKEIIGRYKVVNNSPIADLPEWLSVLIEKPLVTTSVSNCTPIDDEWGTSPYGASALTGAICNILNAENGSRNNVLNEQAFSIGQLIAGGEIVRSVAENGLLNAAIEVGLLEHEAESTIASGFRASEAFPKKAPPLPVSSKRKEYNIKPLWDEKEENS